MDEKMTDTKMGRPTAESELWEWLTKEHARTGVVPPPIEAERQDITTRRTAMRWYRAWVEAGQLERPYDQAWVIPQRALTTTP